MLAVALTLPLLSLLVLGSVWLWQNGYVVHWAIAAALTTLVAFGIERWLLRDAVAEAGRAPELDSAPDPLWHGRELAAWDDVNRIADNIDTSKLDSRDAILALATTTIDTVARRMHAGAKDPLLKFTVPEALALVERVAGELGPFVRENIPLGDRLTVGQFATIYHWRGVIDVAEKAYDIWRIIRLMNPAAAVAQEVRENVTRQLYDWGREELARRLAKAYVREVGRAAIELYSGRLRTSTKALSEVVTDATLADLAQAGATAEPLRIVAIGEASELHSQFISALIRELDRAEAWMRSGGPATAPGPSTTMEPRQDGVLVIDATITGDASKAPESWAEEVRDADLIVWLSSARPERMREERAALEQVTSRFGEQWNARRPPLIVVASHRPVHGQPAGHVPMPSDAAARLDHFADEVASALGVSRELVAPLARDSVTGAFVVTPVVERMGQVAADARRTRVARLIRASTKRGRLTRLWSQAVKAGRLVVGSVGARK